MLHGSCFNVTKGETKICFMVSHCHFNFGPTDDASLFVRLDVMQGICWAQAGKFGKSCHEFVRDGPEVLPP